MTFDPVNNPLHYNMFTGFEVIDITEQFTFRRGNILKYVMRAGIKNADTEIEDLQKAKWYLEREIEVLTRWKARNG